MIYDNYLAHYGVGHLHGGHSGRYPWGSGKKNQSPKSLAERIYETAKAREPGLTEDVKTAARLAGSKMYGLEHRLKDKRSIERKIKTDSEEKRITFNEAAKIKDSVRYTTITPDAKYVRAYYIFKGFMESRGYSEVRCKNYFDLYKKGQVKHKSVQSVFEDKDGFVFEVQFQTPKSQKAKDLKVSIYEERRKVGLSSERKQELEDQMVRLAEAVPYPVDIDKIRSH